MTEESEIVWPEVEIMSPEDARALSEPTDPIQCECGHGSLPRHWHRNWCPNWIDRPPPTVVD